MKVRLLFFFLFLILKQEVFSQNLIYVSPNGNDKSNGSLKSPLGSLEKALEIAKVTSSVAINIKLLAGTYYLPKTLLIEAQYFAGKSLTISSVQEGKARISGGKKLKLKWEKAKGNIWKAHLENPSFEQLFVNGKKQILARYPNFKDSAIVYNGFSPDAIAPKRIATWQNPTNGYVHAMHEGQWGGFHYRITGKRGNEVILGGGGQNNRPSPMHTKYRFVENIFEELDTESEWFFNETEKILYYYPPTKLNLATANIEISSLTHLIELKGNGDTPLSNVRISGIFFTNTERTFMQTTEQLLRSDWCIYRGAAIDLENTVNCTISDCTFTDLGGNAVFISRYNFQTTVKGSYFHHIGASAICLVGDTSAVRSVPNSYGKKIETNKMDYTPGPKNNLYPRQCLIQDNLIHHIGQVEKQVAGVQIQVAAHITVSHNTIYQVPRAAINIGDGAFGGHILEFNDAFETVLETSDHGAFNSWGRDRYWNFKNENNPDLVNLDAQYTTIIRNNRFRCDHGWDVDLDDGSSNYHIYNNVFLKGGLKLREGFFRTAENNIFINNVLHPHVWFKNSGDVIQRNIFTRAYYPIQLDGWGKKIDYNFFASKSYLEEVRKYGTDMASVAGELLFTNPTQGDFTIKKGSKAFDIGFENFPMNQFGVQKPSLKKQAAQPDIPRLNLPALEKILSEILWLGGKIKSVNGLGDRSAYGLPDENGVIVKEVPPSSLLSKSSIQKGDVILKANNETIKDIEALMKIHEQVAWTGHLSVQIMRNQERMDLIIELK